MMKPKWRWIAIYQDGTKVKQPPENQPFLGDLDKSRVISFIVKRGFKSFSLNLRTGQFFEGKRVIADYRLDGERPEFYCARNITQHSTGECERKIIFGFKTNEMFPKLNIEENGKWQFEKKNSMGRTKNGGGG